MTTTTTTQPTVRTVDPEAPRYWTLVGNLTRDVTLRYSATGKPWASTGVAERHRVRGDDGEWADGEPTFYNLVCFGDLAEHLAASLARGDRVVAFGRLEHEAYVAQDGTQREGLKLVADDVGASLRFVEVGPVGPTSGAAPGAGEDWGDGEEPF